MTHKARAALPLVLALALGVPGASRAADTFDINVILPLTGGGGTEGVALRTWCLSREAGRSSS